MPPLLLLPFPSRYLHISIYAVYFKKRRAASVSVYVCVYVEDDEEGCGDCRKEISSILLDVHLHLSLSLSFFSVLP